MARKSKAVFKMAGYTYPGTSPVTRKGGIAKEENVVNKLRDESEEEKVNPSGLIPVTKSKSWSGPVDTEGKPIYGSNDEEKY